MIESLFAMLLVMTLLGMTATLMREYSDASRFMAAKDNTFDGVQFALNEMVNEAGSAVRMDVPSETSPVNEVNTTLRFRRINPDLQRFPDDDDDVLYDAEGEPVMWNTRDTTTWMRVSYDLVDGGLVRTVTPAGGAARSEVMVPKISYLGVTTLPIVNYEKFYRITLSFKEEKGRLRSFELVARRWVKG